MRALRIALSLVALLPSLGAAQVLGRDAEVFTRNETVARGEWFSFHAPMGDITVTEGTGTQVELRAEKILRQGRVTDIGFKVRRTGGGVTICAVYEDDDECTEDGYRSDRRYLEPQLPATFVARDDSRARRRATSRVLRQR